MSLRGNILASYASQGYVSVIGIVVVPQYIKYMGAEAYGLVGFFVMLQAWFNLLELGLTPTIARESARFNGGVLAALDYRRLVRALEGVFLVVTVTGGLLLFCSSGWIGSNWLNASKLGVEEVTSSLQLVAAIVALRWMCGLYRGVITGFEKLVWLSGFNAAVATLRFVAVLPLLLFVDATPVSFFRYQLAVAVFEFAGLAWYSYRLIPSSPLAEHLKWEWANFGGKEL